jgi:hypothetical protein
MESSGETTETLAIWVPISGGGPNRGCLGFENRDTQARVAETRKLLRSLGMKRKKPRLGHLGFLLNPWVALDFATGVQVAGTGFEPVTSRL